MKTPKKPIHPGEILLKEFLEPMELMKAAFAEKKGCAEAKASGIILTFSHHP